MTLSGLFRSGKPSPQPPPVETTAQLIQRLGAHLIRDGFAVAIDPDGVTAATAGRTWRVVAVADDDGPEPRLDRRLAELAAEGPACRCHAEPWADTMPRKATAAEMVRARLELLQYHREHPWQPEG